MLLCKLRYKFQFGDTLPICACLGDDGDIVHVASADMEQDDQDEESSSEEDSDVEVGMK